MPYVKRIVCLANSYKPPGGRCIAGKEVNAKRFGPWIRPVSRRPTAEVSFSEYRYANGSTPALLDVIDVPLSHAAPHNHQTENHVIAAGQWTKTGTVPWSDVPQLLDRPPSLWINRDSTALGANDCMSQAEAATVTDSLLLIEPNDLVLAIGTNPWSRKPTYRAQFSYRGVRYNLSMTDPAARDAFAGKGAGEYPIPDAYICVSLTEPYEHDGRCYKLVAAILTDPPL
jgi:hypothetical protein